MAAGRMFTPKPRQFGQMRIARASDGGLLLIFPGARDCELHKLDPGNWNDPRGLLETPGQKVQRVPTRDGTVVHLRYAKIAPPKGETTKEHGRSLNEQLVIPMSSRVGKLEQLTTLYARCHLWLKRNGFHTAEPLAIHVPRNGPRKLITRALFPLKHATRREIAVEVERVEALGCKPHDWKTEGNVHKDDRGNIVFIDTDLFEVPDKKFQALLDAMWKEARKTKKVWKAEY